MNARTLCIGSLLLSLALVPSTADAAEGPAYQLTLEVDLPIVLIAGTVASSFFFLSELPGPHCAPLCDRSEVNAFDRLAAGNHSSTWATVGHAGTAAVLLLGPISLLIAEGWLDGLNDSLVVAEAALVASAIQVLMSYAVPRPRPRVYSEEAPIEDRTDANAARSFFSGHVGNGIAATLATSIAFFRLDRPIWAWTTFGIGLAGSAFIGFARVESGSHFPTDVLAGAAIGTAIGIAIPALHRSGVSIGPLADAETDARGLTLRAAF